MADQTSEVTSSAVGEKSTISSSSGSIVDSTPVSITNQKLTGNNYLPWSRAVELFITGRGKKDYLSGKMVIPAETDAKFSTWEAENSMIMSWLLGSMIPEISNNFMLSSTAAEIWHAAKEMYSNTDNISELYELESQLKDIKQGDLGVSKYFSSLNQIWQQIDTLEMHQWTCSADSQRYKGIKETRRLFGFLAGLHKDFDAVRGRILSTKPLPSMSTAFSEVRQEESRINVMMKPSGLLSETSALVVKEENKAQEATALYTKRSGQGDTRSSNKKYCKHCQRDGHTFDECYRRPGSTVKPPSSFFRKNHFKPHYSGRSESSNNWKSDTETWRGPRTAVADSRADSRGPVADVRPLTEPIFTQAHLDAVLRVLESQRSQPHTNQIRATMASAGMEGRYSIARLQWLEHEESRPGSR